MKKLKRKSYSQHKILAVFVYCISGGLFCAATAPQGECEWPCFHGLQRNSKSAETGLLKEWQTDLMDNHHGGVILHDGYLYGAGHSARGWFCLDFVTGKQMWNTQGKGSLFYADNMFYLLEEKGTMKLVRATPEKYDIVSSFEVPDGGKGMHWAHPVVCGGRLMWRETRNGGQNGSQSISRDVVGHPHDGRRSTRLGFRRSRADFAS